MFSVSFNSAVSGGLMECERSNKPAGGESFSILRKLQEILVDKELKIGVLKLSICSSEKDLSAVKVLKSNASSSKIKIDELKLVDEIPGDFTSPDGMKEEDPREMERKISCRKLFTDSNEVVKMPIADSSIGKVVHVNSFNGKQVMQQGNEIEQLRKRLKFLEEESKMMRQEFLEQVEERKILMNEIYQHFRVIYHCLQLENPEYGERFFDESFTVNHCKEGGLQIGLPEVQCEVPSSGIVTRGDQRTNIMALREAPEE